MSISKHGFFCFFCGKHCSLIAHVDEGRVVKVTADKESGIPSDVCPDAKGPRTIPATYNHPDRLRHPLRRVGAKGEGKWERISWDEALDTIAQKMLVCKKESGAQSVAMVLGEPKGLEFAFGQRLATVFGTPNVITPGCYCGVQTGAANLYTFGSMMVNADDDTERTGAVMIWGNNPRHIGGTFNGMMPSELDARLARGCKLIVVDPGKIDYAERADLWIKPKPGMDGVLALGMIKVIIEEGLYDPDFVAGWTVGFEDLKAHVATFSLQDVERETWVPADQVMAAARMFAAGRPSILGSGNALEGTVAALQTCRAVSILNGLTGSVGVPGGLVIKEQDQFYRPGRFYFPKGIPRLKENSIANDFILAVGSAYVPTQTLVNTILTGEPYPIRTALFFVTNPLSTYPDAGATYEALKKLEFMVVADIFHTPTTQLADIVLPAALPGEHATIAYWPAWVGYVKCDPKFTDPPGEAWADMKILNELAKRLGVGEYFWEDVDEVLDFMLEPAGMTFEEFTKRRIIPPKKYYLKGNEERFFKTPSGKMEIYSKRMEALGIAPLPYYEEMMKARQVSSLSEEYPLIFTNRKETGFMLSGYRMDPGMRRSYPEAVVEIHPETAARAGLAEGDLAHIETRKGRIVQRVRFNEELDRRVVMPAFGWWYPEEKEDLFGWRKSNLNILVDGSPEELSTGAVQLRGIPCKIGRAPDQGPAEAGGGEEIS
ncbi:MAG: molybdopterin-dependent oxidoreductase [Deltaproteobacteria bacterium]|nr:molybdopterin-dependent oxidoreductase [Deltaproteobacteria bacterium]